MGRLATYFNSFVSLIFPELCQACGNTLVKTERHFCTRCMFQLPYTNFHFDPENKLVKQFWGRVDVQSAAAFLYFNKGGKVQNIMHQLKYNKQPQIGIELGKIYGSQLKETAPYNQSKGIIPVPIHPKMLKKRGYNQSEKFALGLSESMGVPVYDDILFRDKSAESQTHKSRHERFENMKAVFKTAHTKHPLEEVLLVDDTITTGATLEACALELKRIGIAKINIVGIAFTA